MFMIYINNIFFSLQMSEGRRAHVILPDERRLEIQIQVSIVWLKLM